jgi:hypothetical protein
MASRKKVWDVDDLMGQTVAITGDNLPPTVGTVVEQDGDTITLMSPAQRPIIIIKDAITSITQKAAGEK